MTRLAAILILLGALTGCCNCPKESYDGALPQPPARVEVFNLPPGQYRDILRDASALAVFCVSESATDYGEVSFHPWRTNTVVALPERPLRFEAIEAGTVIYNVGYCRIKVMVTR